MYFTQEEKFKRQFERRSIQAKKENLRNLIDEIDAHLLNWEDLETDLQKTTSVNELADWIADLKLDSDLEERVSYLVENFQQVKKGVDNILNILYRLKKNIKSLE